MPIPDGGEALRPFLPAKDFAVSKAFYEALGFAKLLDSEVAIFQVGASAFILQNFYEQALAENMVMQMTVGDVDAWWAHIAALDLPGHFGVKPPLPPELRPWGLRVAFLFDPAGVLWHVAQRREGAASD